MPSLIDIRRRIRSVKNTQQITKAMKMVSAAKLRRAQDKAIAARPYAKMLQHVLANVAEAAAQGADVEQPLLAVRPEKRILAVVITADSGLAGGFNANLIKLAQRFFDEHKNASELSFELIGKKGVNYFRKRTKNIAGEHIEYARHLKFEDAEKIANGIIERFSNGEIDAVYIFTNEFKSVVMPNVTSSRLLPIELPKGGQPVDYIYEQKPEELLGTLLPRYIKLRIYRALLESIAAEHAARMTAMDAASSNAADVIDKLTLYMNRVRQASITREIIEIVSGAAALG
ncbi:MAG TPA: ATP synthase F1 subunit gamma [Bryobacteraceae bacterium]|nr:ATP synthase F1 subunit gamma [Bryobacteraceae bacterium]